MGCPCHCPLWPCGPTCMHMTCETQPIMADPEWPSKIA